MNSYLMNCCSDGKVLESYLLDHSNMSTGARVSSHANPRASKVSEIWNSLVSQGFAFHRDMKNLLAVLFIVAALFSPFAACASIKGCIKANSILTDVRLLRPSTRAVLDGGKYISLIRADGQFEFTNLKPGSYLLEIQSVDYIFPKLRVDVDADSDKIRGTYTQYGSLWDSRGFSLDYPFELRAKATANYFTQPQKFNVLGMFKNPMFLMIGVSAVMMLVLPKMMANMDPEMMKEMNQAQTNMPSLTQILSNPQAAAQQLQQMQQQQQQR